MAAIYGGESASTDWRHLGRLAGFTNQKPQRRNWRGYWPWVKVLYASAGLATQGSALLQAAEQRPGSYSSWTLVPRIPLSAPAHGDAAGADGVTRSAAVVDVANTYASWLQRLRILERFPSPSRAAQERHPASHRINIFRSATS